MSWFCDSDAFCSEFIFVLINPHVFPNLIKSNTSAGFFICSTYSAYLSFFEYIFSMILSFRDALSFSGISDSFNFLISLTISSFILSKLNSELRYSFRYISPYLHKEYTWEYAFLSTLNESKIALTAPDIFSSLDSTHITRPWSFGSVASDA